MKLLLLSLLLPVMAVAQSIEKLDEKNGYKNLKLGMHFDTAKIVADIVSNKGLTGAGFGELGEYRIKKKEYLKFGDYWLYFAFAFFHPETKKLYAINLVGAYADRDRYNSMFGYFTNLYGEPTSSGIYSAVWLGTTCALRIHLDKDFILITIYDPEVMSEREKEAADKERAKSDF